MKEDENLKGASFRIVWCLAGAAVLPFLVTWAYLYASRSTGTGAEVLDLLVLGTCVAVGAFSVAALPASKTVRAFLLLLYVPALFVGLFYFAVAYVCMKFGDCL